MKIYIGVDLKKLNKKLRRIDEEIRRWNESLDKIIGENQHDELSQSMDSGQHDKLRSVRSENDQEKNVPILCGHGKLAECQGGKGVNVGEKGDRPQVGKTADCQSVDDDIS